MRTLTQFITGWRGNFLLSAAEQWLKLELTKNFKVRDHGRSVRWQGLMRRTVDSGSRPAAAITWTRLVQRVPAALRRLRDVRPSIVVVIQTAPDTDDIVATSIWPRTRMMAS